MDTGVTDDVKLLTGDPKRAILVTALPIALASLVQSANNIVDAVWVSGLGTAALAATSVVFPFFFIVIGIGNGIGVGASQAIARRIGSGDYENTHRTAAQSVYMTLLSGAVFTLFLLLFAEQLMEIGSAGEYMQECMDYAYPMFAGTLPIMISCLLTCLLRAEGDARRSMHMSLFGAVLNIVLDPIFIYVLDMGVAGAGWATVIAIVAADALGLYWYFGKRDTFVRIPMHDFRFDREMDWDILKVGIPAALEVVLISVTDLAMYAIISTVDPVNGIAVYGTGWRVINMMDIPALSLGFALVPVAAAAYGARDGRKLREGYYFSMRFGLCMMVAITLFTILFAPWIVMLFTYSNPELSAPITEFVRTVSLFMPTMAIGFASVSLFQALGMGFRSLLCSVIMNAARIPVCALLSLSGVLMHLWLGIVGAEVFGAFLSFAWAMLTVRVLVRERNGTASA